MCEHLHYESVYFKELHKERAEYYIQGGAAVVSTITSIPFFEGNCQSETELQSMRIIIGNTSVTGRVTLFLTMRMSQFFAKLGLNSMSCGLLKIVCPDDLFRYSYKLGA